MSKVGLDDHVTETGATAESLDGLPSVAAWPQMAPEAYHGPAGELVEVVSPYSEGDPVSALVHVLVAIGNLIGPGPHVRVQHDHHPARLFAALVGDTSKGRKGLSWSTPRYVCKAVDPEWARRRITSGLSSGEGLIFHVRDERIERQPVREKGRVVDYQDVVVDAGEPDKRLLGFEPELASVFKRMGGDTNSLSAVLRQAWDDHPLGTLTKASPLRATGAHLSLIGHVTADELRQHLTETERANGFGNRWLYVLVRRARILPDGTPVPDAALEPIIGTFRRAAEKARGLGEVHRDADAAELWRSIYPALSSAEPGLVGAVLGRAEAQVLRLSLTYALLGGSKVIQVPHLQAAVAVWDYCADSARRIFAGRLGLGVADTVLEVLRTRGAMTTTEIHGIFGRHRRKDEIHAALGALRDAGKVHPTTRETGGRPATTWEITPQ
jgi:hypothetical protein